MAVMDKQALLALCERGVDAARAAGADLAEVYASSSESREVAFEKNDINIVRVIGETAFGVRVFVGGRMGFATSNRPEALAEVAAEAVTLAKASPADPLNGLPEPQPILFGEDPVDPALLEMSLAELAKKGDGLLREALGRDKRLTVDSGSLTISEDTSAVASSLGVRASFRDAYAQGSLFGMARDGGEVGSFSYDGDAVRHADELEPKLSRAFERFVGKCVGALGAGKGESFRGPVIVPPDAVGDLLMGDVLGMLSAAQVRKGRSPFAEKVGEVVASDKVTLVEAGAGLDGFPLNPFDREGMPRSPLALIEGGVLGGFLYDGYEARAAGRQSAGHARGGASSQPRVGAGAVRLAPGDTPLATIDKVERGIYVTRFSGSSDPVSGEFSGVVKGGFLIRDGERTPITETTLSGNLYDCLKNISAVSDTAEVRGGTRAWPTIRVEDVSVTAG